MSARPAEPDHGSQLPAADAGGGSNAALEREDDLVQQLAIAKYALVAGDTEQAMGAIDAALTSSRGSLTELTEAGGTPSAGSMIRSTPAGSPPPPAAATDEPVEPVG